MFFTAFAIGIVILVLIIFYVRSRKKNSMSNQEIKKEEKEGIID